MKKRVFSTVLAILLMTAVLVLPIVNSGMTAPRTENNPDNVSKSPTALVDQKPKPENKPTQTLVKNDKQVNVIVELSGASLLDTVLSSDGVYNNVPQLVLTDDGKVCMDTIKKNQAVVKASIQKLLPDSDFSDSRTYSAALNGFSVRTNMSSIPKIRKINGVKQVTVVESVLYPEDDMTAAAVGSLTQTEKELANVSAAYESGFDGTGILIAVIDSEFDTAHEVFSAVPPAVKYNKEQMKNLYRAAGFGTDKKYSIDEVYHSEKIIYAYDYEENDNDTYTAGNAHGTAVAALTAGDNGLDDENAFQGMAYHAQLALMKVSDSSGQAAADRILSALDDCAKLGADIVNISLGADRSIDIMPVFRESLDKLSQTGTMIVCPSGNSGFNSRQEMLSAADIDYGALNVLACVDGTTAVASSDNSYLAAEYLMADGNLFFYHDVPSDDEEAVGFAEAVTEPAEYIYLSDDTDYRQAENKIAVITLGERDLQEQVQKAFLADVRALALIAGSVFEKTTYNNSISLSEKRIPVIFLYDDSDYFEAEMQGIIGTGETTVLLENDGGNGMSDSSSWGVTPDLKLKPEIAAVGQNVYSALPDGKYGYLSGTSAASAMVSGTYALLRQYLREQENFSYLSAAEQSRMAAAVLMSNSEPVKQYSYEEEELLYVSPRKQGAGRTDIAGALQSGAYLEVWGSEKPKAELGDSQTGEYSFDFIVHNLSDMPQTFSLRYYIQTDCPEIVDDDIINTRQPYSLREYAMVTFEQNDVQIEEITMESDSEMQIHAAIKLDGLYALTMMQYFPNGFYVDGYVVLENTEGRTLNLPFMGFCGSWEKISPFAADETVFCAADYNGTMQPVVLGRNPFTGRAEDIAVSTNTVGNYYDLSQLKNAYLLPDFYLLRDAYEFTVSVSDENGKQLLSHNYGTVSADRDVPMYRKLFSESGETAVLFSDLSDGKYLYTVSARTMKSDGTLSGQTFRVQTEFFVDSGKPEVVLSETYEKDKKVYLELSARDNRSVQGFEIYTAAYNAKTKKYEYADKWEELVQNGYVSENACILQEVRHNNDGTFTFVYDITELYGELVRLQFMTRTSDAPCSSVRIAYKAVDGAYNVSSVKIADAVAYQSAELTLKDQNGNPAQGITLSLDNRAVVTDRQGRAVFDKLLPDVYPLQITDMPEGYRSEERYFLLRLEKHGGDVHREIVLQFDGEYSEISEEESSEEESSREESLSPAVNYDMDKDSFGSLLFVGILLFISAFSLALIRKRRK